MAERNHPNVANALSCDRDARGRLGTYTAERQRLLWIMF